MERQAIPKATLGRLPQYLRYLQELPPELHTHVSATTIAKELSLGEVQVRKDLSLVSGAGKPRVGYVTADLIRRIEQALGGSRLTPAVLVGAGRLGRALLEYNGFEEYGVSIAAGFDISRQLLRSEVGGKDILPMSRLEDFCRERNVRIGIITVGQDSAQEVCNRLLACGITAIWNFAPCRLEVPRGVALKQENLALSLAYLNNQICESF